MVQFTVTGTIFIAIIFAAALFFFAGAFVQQLGETTGLVTLEETGRTGTTIGTIIAVIFVIAFIIVVAFMIRGKS